MREGGSQLVWGDALVARRESNAKRMAALLDAPKLKPVDGVGLVTAETAGFIENAKSIEIPTPPAIRTEEEEVSAQVVPEGALEIPIRVIDPLQDQADPAQPVPEHPGHLELVSEAPEVEETIESQDASAVIPEMPGQVREDPTTARAAEAQAFRDESEEGLDRLSPAYLNGRAKAILALKMQYRDDPEAGFRAGVAKFVEAGAEPDPRLQKFSKLLLVADRVSETAARLVQYETWISRQEAMGANVLADRQRKKRLACSYNQLWGSLVEENEEAMPPEWVRRWLEGLASDSSEDNWAEAVTLGMQAELIGMKLVQGLGEPSDDQPTEARLTGIKHGDLDQDLRGMDIVFDQTRAGYDSLDVKRQELRGVVPVQRSVATGRLTLYIDPGDIIRNTYELRPGAARMYRACLRTVLIEGKVLNQQTIEEMRVRYGLEPAEAMDEAA